MIGEVARVKMKNVGKSNAFLEIRMTLRKEMETRF